MKRIGKFIKNNIKVVIAFIIGVLITGTTVYAASILASSVSYDNSNSELSSTNVQGALDELYEKSKTHCPDGKVCIDSWVKIGDYVKMTPKSTSYTTDTSMTGYSSTQTINPSELNLWRVIGVNSDGTVNIVSVYVSSVSVYFSGQTGYQNFVGYLNTIAHQYENSNYTVSSKHMGYSNQTPYITDTTALTATTAPQTSSTSSSNVTSATEAKGLGDIGYKTDYNLVNEALGTLKAYQVGTTIATEYWVASRHYSYYSSTRWIFYGNGINTSGSGTAGNLHIYYSGSFYKDSISKAIRPILTLKSGLSPSSGDGSRSSPYVLS